MTFISLNNPFFREAEYLHPLGRLNSLGRKGSEVPNAPYSDINFPQRDHVFVNDSMFGIFPFGVSGIFACVKKAIPL